MRLVDGQFLLSPSDLSEHLACEHLTELRRAVELRELERPHRHDPHAEIVARRGDEHEAAYLAGLRDVTRIDRPRDGSLAALRERADETLAAMRAGAPIVYQATFFDGRWRGHADFLERVEKPSGLGGWSYEVADTKLARTARPSHVLQLCSYSEHVERLQGVPPEHAHLVLGDGTRETLRLADFAAVYRRAAARLEARLEGSPIETYPEPVNHCQFCDFAGPCWAQRRRDDHLSLVAGARRDQREKLAAIDITTVRGLGETASGAPSGRLIPQSFERLRSQADLQVRTRDTGALQRRDLEPEAGRGYARLPLPDEGDMFFDLEGDPFVDGGLEYLWGFELRRAEGWRFEAWWAHDRMEEKRTFEHFVDLVVQRRRDRPGMHVYHYAPHEAATLKRLASHHATREDQVDDLLREGVLVDLYAVLRQAMQVGQESYSIKAIEPFYMPPRNTEVKEAGGSIVAYETWLKTNDASVLHSIYEYNRDDVVSNRLLRDWLRACRAEAEASGVVFVAAPDEEPWPEPGWWDAHVQRLERLQAALPDDPDADTPAEAERRLLAALLDYHRREAKPQWWRHFDLLAKSSHELIDDTDAIGGLALDAGAPVEQVKKSLGYWMTFPPQEHRLSLGDVIDPLAGKDAGEIVAFDQAGARLLLKRGGKFDGLPLPAALIGPKPLRTTHQREAIAAVADTVLAGHDAFAAVRSVVRREMPRVNGIPAGAPLQPPHVGEAEMQALVSTLDDSHLVVQGPPGSGKTYLGARLIVELLDRGWRIGVAASSHKAIHNLLHEIEDVATARGVEVRGFHKCSGAGSEFESEHELIDSANSNDQAEDPELNLVSGTAWLFSRPGMREHPFDLLVIDEAGQVALADAVAMGTAARRLVFLGDPQQLPQVTQADHPGTSGCSVLAHLLGDRPTVPPERGLFLTETWRMHPDVCSFISETYYEDRLFAVPGCTNRRIEAAHGLTGAGLRHLAVEHVGNAQASPEEAATIAAACEALIGGRVVLPDGSDRELRSKDILVVAPYNLAVREIGAAVPDGVRVGTVDKFQGQEAPVVFYAMTSSSGEDAPRGLEFLFSRNRLNVAISRAQCLAVLVATPALLDADAREVQQLRLLNGTCRFVELAETNALRPAPR